MNMRIRTWYEGRLLAGVSLLFAASVPVSALAQAGPDNARAEASDAADQGGLEDIVVTARKVAENLQDVPVAVTAFSGADLAAQNAQRVQDVARFTPGLIIRPGNASSTSLTIALRGQAQTDVLATLDPSVGTYVDGIYWARAYGLNGSLLDIQSVQVLKGPQGTLFGRNTTGGAMLINSNDPELGEFSGRLSATYGRFDERELVGIVNIPIGDKVALRLAATGFERDGYTTNSSSVGIGPTVTERTLLGYGPGVTSTTPLARALRSPNGGPRLDDRWRRNARAKLLVEPVDNLSLLFSAEYFKVDENPSNAMRLATSAFAPVPDPTLPAPNRAAFISTNNNVATAATMVGLLSGAPPATATAAGLTILNNLITDLNANRRQTMSNDVGYAYAKTQTYNFIGTLDTFFGAIKLLTNYRKVHSYAGFDNDGSPYPILFSEGQQKLKQLSGEVQITGKAFGDTVDFAAGAFVFNETGFDQSLSIALPTLNPLTSQNLAVIDNDSMGVYGQATWHLSDKLSLTGGLRYSADDKGIDSRNFNYVRSTGTVNCLLATTGAGTLVTFSSPTIQPFAPAQCSAKRRDSFDGVSYTAGIEYQPNDDILLYAKTAKGFRSGGQNLRASTLAQFRPFKPEVAYSYETGVKAEFLDRRLRVNVAGYITNVKDLQRSTILAATSGSVSVLGNIGKARFRGVEAEVTALLFEGFRVTAAGALVDPQYIDFVDLSGDRSGERFATVSKKQYSLAADYDTDLGSDLRLRLHADYSWRSKQATDPYNFPLNPNNLQVIAATTSPAYGLLGARGTLEIGENYEVSIFGRNLTNSRNVISTLFVRPLGMGAATTTQEPRTYGITGTVKF
jgi:iron complex outermembrane receptor protein